MKTLLLRFQKDQSGQALTEYALILAVVAIAVVAAMTLFRDELVLVFENIQTSLSGASGSSS